MLYFALDAVNKAPKVSKKTRLQSEHKQSQ